MPTDQLRVKLTSTPNLPATYVQMDANGQAVTKHMNAGVPGKAFDPKVSENGDQWVTVNGLVNTGVALSATGQPFAAPPSILSTGSYLQNSTSLAYEASRLVKSTAGVAYGVSGYSSLGASQWIQMFNWGAGTIPPNGTIPVVTIVVPTVANFSIDFGYWGRMFPAGIWIANSTTGPTLTVGAADTFFDVRFV